MRYPLLAKKEVLTSNIQMLVCVWYGSRYVWRVCVCVVGGGCWVHSVSLVVKMWGHMGLFTQHSCVVQRKRTVFDQTLMIYATLFFLWVNMSWYLFNTSIYIIILLPTVCNKFNEFSKFFISSGFLMCTGLMPYYVIFV